MPARVVPVGRLDEFPDGTLVPADADGTKVVVARSGDEVCVAVNRCPHLGFSLTKGPGGLKYADGVVQCAWHNSRFQLCSGENLDWVGGLAGRDLPRWSSRLLTFGRKPRGLNVLPARVEDGSVMVEVEE